MQGESLYSGLWVFTLQKAEDSSMIYFPRVTALIYSVLVLVSQNQCGHYTIFLPVPVYVCIEWALLGRKIFTDSKLKMDMDVHWKTFRVFNYLTDVCVNLILCYPNVTVKDNSKKKNIICSACLLVFMWMFIVFFKTSRRKYEQMEKLEEAATNCKKVIKSFVYNGSTNNGKWP